MGTFLPKLAMFYIMCYNKAICNNEKEKHKKKYSNKRGGTNGRIRFKRSI